MSVDGDYEQQGDVTKPCSTWLIIPIYIFITDHIIKEEWF